MRNETRDVLAVDINLDGLDDIYVGNWFGNGPNNCGQTFSTRQQDELCLNNPAAPGTFINASNLLPDNPAYVGPTPLGPWAANDVEAVTMPLDAVAAGTVVPKDFDHDGDVDIFIALGTSGIPLPAQLGVPTAGINRGIIILVNQQAQNPPGPLPPFVANLTLTGIGAAGAAVLTDYNDIELGDWLLFSAQCCEWFEKDIGAGTQAQGHFVHKKNQG